MKKKICLFSLNYLTFGGGAEKYLSEVGRSLSLRGHGVTFLGDCKGLLSTFPVLGWVLGMVPLRCIPSAIREIRLAPSVSKDLPFSAFRLRLSVFFPFSSHRRSVNKLLDSCDAILVRNEFIDMVCLYLIAPRHLKKSLAIMFASLYYPSPRTLRAKTHNLVYLSRFYGFLLRKFAAVVVSNKFDQPFVAKHYLVLKRAIFLVPYGLADSDFAFKKGNASSADRFAVSFVGRLEEQKGVDYLPLLLSQLSKKKSSDRLEFRIAGSGPQEVLVKGLASSYPSVEYCGFLESGELSALYDRSDVVVVPSRWETFSYVTLEAQSRGTLVVAFDVSGPNEIIVDGKSGFIVPLGRVDLLAGSILSLYKLKDVDLKKYREMQKFAHKHARTDYSLDRTVGRLERIIDAVCE